MPVKTYAEELIEVQTAISAIITGGQDYSIQGQTGGRALSRANLGELQEREKWLRAQAAKEARGAIRVRGATPV